MSWFKENLGVALAALVIGFIFTAGVFHLFGEVGVAVFLLFYFFVFLPWLKKRSD